MKNENFSPIPEISNIFRIFLALLLKISRQFIISWTFLWNSGKIFSLFFFRAHRTKDHTRKQEKVGPFECDVLEKKSSRKCKMLSSYSTYPTQWQKKKNTKKTNQPWTLLDRSRVLFCKCCRISSLLIIEIGCRSHSLTHLRTRLRSHSRSSSNFDE